MGLCGSVTTTPDINTDDPTKIVAVKVAPRKVGDGRTSKLHEERKLERQTSGTDLSLKEALTNVFQFSIVNKYGPVRKRKSRDVLLLEKINCVTVVRGEVSHLPGLPDVNSDEFEAQANAIFEEIDTNHDGNMSLEEFTYWYMNSGPEPGVRGRPGHMNASFAGEDKAVARAFYEVINMAVRRAEKEIASRWLARRGGFTDDEAHAALQGLFEVYDTNGDGVLDAKEFGALMLEIQDARLEAEQRRIKGLKHDLLSQRAAKRIIHMMDEDGDGVLDMDEFIDTLRDSLAWNDDRCRAAADRLAANDEGIIDEELSDHLVEFFEAIVWCISKYIKSGGATRKINLGRFFESDRQQEMWEQG